MVELAIDPQQLKQPEVSHTEPFTGTGNLPISTRSLHLDAGLNTPAKRVLDDV